MYLSQVPELTPLAPFRSTAFPGRYSTASRTGHYRRGSLSSPALQAPRLTPHYKNFCTHVLGKEVARGRLNDKQVCQAVCILKDIQCIKQNCLLAESRIFQGYEMTKLARTHSDNTLFFSVGGGSTRGERYENSTGTRSRRTASSPAKVSRCSQITSLIKLRHHICFTSHRLGNGISQAWIIKSSRRASIEHVVRRPHHPYPEHQSA